MRAVVTGARGLLGEEVVDWLEGNEGDQVIRLRGRDELDIADTQAVVSFMRRVKPDFIVHCAAERDMDAAECNPRNAYMVNYFGTWNVALAAGLCDSLMVFISSEAVYDGKKDTMYTEDDPKNPLNVYGRSKAMAEEEVKSLLDKYFILRVPILFGGKGRTGDNRILNTVSALRSGECVTAPADQWTSPTYARDVAMAIGRMTRTPDDGHGLLACHGVAPRRGASPETGYGVYAVANKGKTSRYEFVCKLAELAGCKRSYVRPGSREGKPARRGRNTALDCACLERTFGLDLRPWEDALSECLKSMGLSS
ncbi:MAG: NAD(P)-dependent oxidoreductase [Firmicutes bacterium]|jgi:dTDP-4-dehydrorhamnose reductase|nr:NAD(P)-dependent oxidoreductase [Bacillota bacterium]MDD4337165.1 NAD(P)-dependent oxidoreductase [Bacillota bacterium]MDD4793112.1 NAD(P)-dependent oxidoreductase [Bacillota bacterium]